MALKKTCHNKTYMKTKYSLSVLKKITQALPTQNQFMDLSAVTISKGRR